MSRPAPAKKVAAPAKKVAAPAKKAAAPAKKAAAPAKKAAAGKVPAKKAAAPAKKAPARKVPAKKAAAAGTSSRVGVPPATDETFDLTPAEIAAIRAELEQEVREMQAEYEHSLADLDDLQQAGTDGAGDDQADAGSKTFEREQELSIAGNRLDLLTQMHHAIDRIDKGTYGYCENCGKPIPRARLQAFPMATLDVGCKQREERR